VTSFKTGANGPNEIAAVTPSKGPDEDTEPEFELTQDIDTDHGEDPPPSSPFLNGRTELLIGQDVLLENNRLSVDESEGGLR